MNGYRGRVIIKDANSSRRPSLRVLRARPGPLWRRFASGRVSPHLPSPQGRCCDLCFGDDDGLALDRVRAVPAQAPTGEHGSSLQAEKKRLETLKNHFSYPEHPYAFERRWHGPSTPP